MPQKSDSILFELTGLLLPEKYHPGGTVRVISRAKCNLAVLRVNSPRSHQNTLSRVHVSLCLVGEISPCIGEKSLAYNLHQRRYIVIIIVSLGLAALFVFTLRHTAFSVFTAVQVTTASFFAHSGFISFAFQREPL